MAPKFIPTHLQTTRCAVLMAAAMLAGCSDDAGDPPPPIPPDAADAAPRPFTVRGTAFGVLGPLTMELRLDGDVESLTITEEGPFAFETTLADGASYTVAFKNPDAPCTLSNETGTVAGADPSIEVSCVGRFPATVLVSGVEESITVFPGTTDYLVEIPMTQESATLTVTSTALGDWVYIAGTLVYSGMATAPIPLEVGDNPVDIVVENPLNWEQGYVLTLRRAAAIAQ